MGGGGDTAVHGGGGPAGRAVGAGDLGGPEPRTHGSYSLFIWLPGQLVGPEVRFSRLPSCPLPLGGPDSHLSTRVRYISVARLPGSYPSQMRKGMEGHGGAGVLPFLTQGDQRPVAEPRNAAARAPGPQGPQPQLHPQAFPEWKCGVGVETWWEVVPVSTPIPRSQGPVIARAV